jgi:hypothetical protein
MVVKGIQAYMNAYHALRSFTRHTPGKRICRRTVSHNIGFKSLLKKSFWIPVLTDSLRTSC